MNNKGITLITLSMYVVGLLLVVITVATLTSFFYGNVVNLRDSVDSLGEFDKFNVAFLEEVKNDKLSIASIEETKIAFSNGVIFHFQDEGIYKNYVKICEQVKDCKFSASSIGEKTVIKVYLEIGTDFAKTLEYTGKLKLYNQNGVKVTQVILKDNRLVKSDNENVNPVLVLQPRILPDNASNKTLKWKSSDESIAKVDENGIVTYITDGEVTITATATDGSDIFGTCIISCEKEIPLTELTLAKETVTLTKTDTSTENPTVQMEVTLTPNNANNVSLSWESSDDNVASIDENGLVTWKKIGKATITCTGKDGSGSYSDSCEIKCEYLDTTTGPKYAINRSEHRTNTNKVSNTTSFTVDVTNVSTLQFVGKYASSSGGTNTITITCGEDTVFSQKISTGTTYEADVSAYSGNATIKLYCDGTPDPTWYYVAYNLRVNTILFMP